MENKERDCGIGLANLLFGAFENTFSEESFYNGAQIKRWLGQGIKDGAIVGYRNLKYRNYKVVVDMILVNTQTYHVGIDFGRQAVHVTLGLGDVYSLYFRDPSVSE